MFIFITLFFQITYGVNNVEDCQKTNLDYETLFKSKEFLWLLLTLLIYCICIHLIYELIRSKVIQKIQRKKSKNRNDAGNGITKKYLTEEHKDSSNRFTWSKIHPQLSPNNSPKKEMSNLWRMEADTMGELLVPKDKYWGAQTQRSLQNFPIGGEREKMPITIVRAFGILKKATAKVYIYICIICNYLGKY